MSPLCLSVCLSLPLSKYTHIYTHTYNLLIYIFIIGFQTLRFGSFYDLVYLLMNPPPKQNQNVTNSIHLFLCSFFISSSCLFPGVTLVLHDVLIIAFLLFFSHTRMFTNCFLSLLLVSSIIKCIFMKESPYLMTYA